MLIAATYPRVVVDLNREPDELDPDLVADPDAMAELRVTAGRGPGSASCRAASGEPLCAGGSTPAS